MTEMLTIDGKELKTEPYQESFGEICFPEGFEKKLEKLPLDKQTDCYRLTQNVNLARTAYGEVEKSDDFKYSRKLQDYEELVSLVIKDDLIVGVRIKSWPDRTAVLLPYECACTYYASDNEGSGYNDREDYAYFICV